MIIMETHQITQLTVFTKNSNAALFDANAYKATTLYFKNKDLAVAYTNARFSGCEYKLDSVTAAKDEASGNWTILNKTQRVLSLDSGAAIDGKHSVFSHDISIPLVGDYAIGLTARQTKLRIENNEKGLRKPRYIAVDGYSMEPAGSMKDVSHVLCDIEGLLYMATPRKEPVDLVSSAEIAKLIAELESAIALFSLERQKIKNQYGEKSREFVASATHALDLNRKMTDLIEAEAKPMKSYMDEGISRNIKSR